MDATRRTPAVVRDQVRVLVHSADPLSAVGLAGALRSRPDFTVLTPTDGTAAGTDGGAGGADDRWVDVVVLATDGLSTRALTLLRRVSRATGAPVVLVADHVDPSQLLTAVEQSVVAVLPRTAAVGQRLAQAVHAAANGGGVMSPTLLGELLKDLQRLQREVLTANGLSTGGLTSREVDVLRLVAEGLDTAEIADVLNYSERTVKNVIHALTTRLNLRNRPHAVAYALRAGII